MKLHIAKGLAQSADGTAGWWPLKPICGDRSDNPLFYKDHTDLMGTVEPCVTCFSDEDYPLILLGQY